jgi:hypothetical protein
MITNVTKHESLLPLESLFKNIVTSHAPKITQPQQSHFYITNKKIFPIMTTPQYSTYPGLGEWAKETLHYQQAVKIGNTIKISGQGSPSPTPSHLSLSPSIHPHLTTHPRRLGPKRSHHLHPLRPRRRNRPSLLQYRTCTESCWREGVEASV